MTIFKQTGFGNDLFKQDRNGEYLNATGPGDSIGDVFRRSLGLYVAPADSILQSKDTLTTLDPTLTKKTTDWGNLLSTLFGIGGSVATSYFDSQGAKASGSLSAEDIAQAVKIATAQQQADAQAKAKQQQTIIIAVIVGVVLLAGSFLIFRKK